MTTQIQDRRIKKTRKSLHDALTTLLFEKSYDQIVVQDILDRANVGRSTFYLHFRDIDELLKSSMEDLHRWLRSEQSAPLAPTAKRNERLIRFSLPMFEHTRAFRRLIESLLQSKAAPVVMESMRTMVVDLIAEETRKQSRRRRKRRSKVPLEILIEYVASTFILVLTWWINRKSSMSPRSINSIFRSLVLPTLDEHI